MYVIQMFDCRKSVRAWDDGVTGPINSIEEAESELAQHEKDWPNCIFRIARDEPI